MGKSKRIRADRARDAFSSPEKYSEQTAARKARNTTIILVAVIALIIVTFATLAVLNKTGAFMRMSTVYSTENFEVNGAEVSYIYSSIYQEYYYQGLTYGGESIAQYVAQNATTPEKITAHVKEMLILCEEAKAQGIELTEEDLTALDEEYKTLKKSLKDSGFTFAEMYGSGITGRDIKNVMKLEKLAGKIEEKKFDEFEALLKEDDAKIKEFVEDNKELFYIGGYVGGSIGNAEYYDKLKGVTDADEFKKIFIEYMVSENLLADYNSEVEEEDKVEKLGDSIYKALCAAIGYAAYDLEIEGYEGETFTEITETVWNNVYPLFKVEGEALTEDQIEVLAEVGEGICEDIKKSLTVDDSFSYPTDSDDDHDHDHDHDETTDAPSDETTPSDSSSAKADSAFDLVSGDTTSDSSDEEEIVLTGFEAWLFESGEAKVGDVYLDENGKDIYLVTKVPALDTEKVKNVAHILVQVTEETIPSKATDEEKAEIEKNNEKLWADAEKEAKDLLAQLGSNPTKDAFVKLGEEKTDDSGVEYENVFRGQMVTEFNDWVYDSARKVGDVDIVKTTYGYHVIYFDGEGELANWEYVALYGGLSGGGLIDQEYATWNAGLTHTVTVNEKALAKILPN